jgi:hypothetical protein
MEDPSTIVGLAGIAAAGLAIASAATLRAWTQWLHLRRKALSLGLPDSRASAVADGELETLRRRVRRLEAIASGTEGQTF